MLQKKLVKTLNSILRNLILEDFVLYFLYNQGIRNFAIDCSNIYHITAKVFNATSHHNTFTCTNNDTYRQHKKYENLKLKPLAQWYR